MFTPSVLSESPVRRLQPTRRHASRRWLPVAALLALACSSTAQHQVFHRFAGAAAYDEFGSSVGNAGDVNGDGFADVIVGAPKADANGTNSGSAFVLSGRDGAVLYTFHGAGGDQFGTSVAGAGDVDRDGYADVIVGAPFAYSTDGAAYVFSGRDGSRLGAWSGSSPGDGLGRSVGGAGDLDGDGYDDVIMGAEKGLSGNGEAYLYSVRHNTTLHRSVGSAWNDLFGWSVSGAGDVDGDGRADVIVGAPIGNYARVISGRPPYATLYTFTGDTAGDQFGRSVSGAGDVDGDGYPDLVIGAPFDDNAGTSSGSARVFSGSTGVAIRTLSGDASGQQLGWSVCGAGDVNGDGRADVVVGARLADGPNGWLGTGEVRVLSGRDGTMLSRFFGESVGDSAGFSVGGGGDVDGDGFADVVVGACLANANGVDAGAVLVLDASMMIYEFEGDRDDLYFGRAVGVAGDVNRDGIPDLIVGSPQATTRSGSNSGRVRVFSGADGTTLRTIDGGAAWELLGMSVSGAGDVDGDTYADIIVGAPGGLFNSSSEARVISGRSWTTIHTLRGGAAEGFGRSVAGVGDVNRDGYDDVVVGASLAAYTGVDSGSGYVFSGRNGSLLFRIDGDAGDSLGFSVAAAGDADADGTPDVIVGAIGQHTTPGHARVVSGRSGAVLWRLDGEAAGDQFGHSVSGAGDVDGDGHADVIVGAPGNDRAAGSSGMAAVVSGRTGRTLHVFYGAGSAERLGYAVGGAGDVNGDGRADLVVASKSWVDTVKIFSGLDGSELASVQGTPTAGRLGEAVAGVGDLNGDGRSEVIIGGQYAGTLGTGGAYVYSHRFGGTGVTYGTACAASSSGPVPRISLGPGGGRPVVGGSYIVEAHATPPNQPGSLWIGVNRIELDLAFLGFPGCVVRNERLVSIRAVTGLDGRASLALSVPQNASLLGVAFQYQWLVLDFTVPGLAVSNGLTVTFGWQ